LKGHNFGNIFLSAIEKTTGSFDKAVVEASRILRIKGWVFPVTLRDTRLVAVFKNGKKIVGQKNFSYCEDDYANLKKLYLTPKAEINPRILKILKSLKKTDKIVISPGNFYSTLIPNFLVSEFSKAIKESKAKVICVVNLMAREKQTDSFTINDYMANLEKYLGKEIIKYVIYNTETPNKTSLKKYSQAGEKLLTPKGLEKTPGVEFIGRKLLNKEFRQIKKSDALSKRRSLIRHDGKKLAKIIINI
jgi:uncharacterized cofD-like protein